MYTLSKSTQSWLVWFLKGSAILVFFILFARLFELQVIKGNYYQTLADENRVRRVIIQAPRGKILAKNGEVLADNTPVKKKIEFDEIDGYQKLEVYENAREDELITEYNRHYPLEEAAAHLLGYIGEVNEDELGQVDSDCIDHGSFGIGDKTGRGGLEQYYDCSLRGINGEDLVEVNHTGEKIRSLGRRPPLPGSDLVTNIDYDLQKRLSEIVDNTELKDLDTDLLAGAIVVSDRVGRIKAMYSFPSYDNNIFIGKTNTEEIGSLMGRKDLPLFNRSISGNFAPGSVYKPIISLASLQDKFIDKDYTFVDTGVISVNTNFGNFNYSNWYYTQYGGQEGAIDLKRALARSTDTFYYKLGEIMGIDNIVKWNERFGLNATTNLDLPGEISGLIPNPEWKLQTKGERWFLGNTYHVSIGQGDMALTPALINRATLAVATGRLCDLRIVGEGDCHDLGIDYEHLTYVRDAMHDACSPGGTGFTFFTINTAGQEKYPQVGCKTGTAETGVNDKSHAWFVFFAPIVDPEIVVTVLVEEGGSGSGVAGVLAREIYNTYFDFKADSELGLPTSPAPSAIE